jgi:hypothetical protein
MSVSGHYVGTFAEASHALPERMSMNADYPFMLPRVVAITATSITLEGRGGQQQRVAIRRNGERECCYITQKSSYERFVVERKRGTRFCFYPFKDELTDAIGQPTEERKSR